MDEDGIWCNTSTNDDEMAAMGVMVLHHLDEPLYDFESALSMGTDLRQGRLSELLALEFLCALDVP